MVVLTLTGFSTGRHGRHGGSGSGGGCSSSGQDHDSSSSTTSGGTSGGDSYDDSYDSDDSYGSGGSYTRRPNHRSTPTSSSSGSGEDLLDGTAKLVSCATEKNPYATVEVGNPNDSKARFEVWVDFEDEKGEPVDSNNARVTVAANGKARVRVEVDGGTFADDGLIYEIDHCEVEPAATPEG